MRVQKKKRATILTFAAIPRHFQTPVPPVYNPPICLLDARETDTTFGNDYIHEIVITLGAGASRVFCLSAHNYGLSFADDVFTSSDNPIPLV